MGRPSAPRTWPALQYARPPFELQPGVLEGLLHHEALHVPAVLVADPVKPLSLLHIVLEAAEVI